MAFSLPVSKTASLVLRFAIAKGSGPMPCRARYVAMNVARMLARSTNDRWLSTPRRVRNLSSVARYSEPLLCDMSLGCASECLPGCHSESLAPEYSPVLFGDYLLERLNKNDAYRQQPAAWIQHTTLRNHHVYWRG